VLRILIEKVTIILLQFCQNVRLQVSNIVEFFFDTDHKDFAKLVFIFTVEHLLNVVSL